MDFIFDVFCADYTSAESLNIAELFTCAVRGHTLVKSHVTDFVMLCTLLVYVFLIFSYALY